MGIDFGGGSTYTLGVEMFNGSRGKTRFSLVLKYQDGCILDAGCGGGLDFSFARSSR
jgi:hypothetical protein